MLESKFVLLCSKKFVRHLSMRLWIQYWTSVYVYLKKYDFWLQQWIAFNYDWKKENKSWNLKNKNKNKNMKFPNTTYDI
jgi:hypothetical protein